jgi:hypothetical protein
MTNFNSNWQPFWDLSKNLNDHVINFMTIFGIVHFSMSIYNWKKLLNTFLKSDIEKWTYNEILNAFKFNESI